MTKAATRPEWLEAALHDVPAMVLYAPSGRRACVLHVFGDDHPSAVAARERLTRKGYELVPLTSHPSTTTTERGTP